MTDLTMQMRTISEGAIKTMSVPADWFESMQTPQGEGAKYSREFVCSDDKNVRIVIYYRGLPVSIPAAVALKSVLAAEPHQLSEEEQLSVDDVVGNANIPVWFALDEASTCILDGKTVLLYEGKWLASNNHCYQLYIPATDDCRVLQELWLLAPHGSFPEWRDVFNEVLESVRLEQ